MGREGIWLSQSLGAESKGQAAKLEKTLNDVRQKISKSIATRERGRNEESVECVQNAKTEDQNLHMEEREPVPDEQPNTLSSDARELLESSAYFYTQIHPCEGDFRNRSIAWSYRSACRRAWLDGRVTEGC